MWYDELGYLKTYSVEYHIQQYKDKLKVFLNKNNFNVPYANYYTFALGNIRMYMHNYSNNELLSLMKHDYDLLCYRNVHQIRLGGHLEYTNETANNLVEIIQLYERCCDENPNNRPLVIKKFTYRVLCDHLDSMYFNCMRYFVPEERYLADYSYVENEITDDVRMELLTTLGEEIMELSFDTMNYGTKSLKRPFDGGEESSAKKIRTIPVSHKRKCDAGDITKPKRTRHE